MAVLWEYEVARVDIEDVHSLPDLGTAKAKEFMNILGKDGWEIFIIHSVMLGTTQYISFTCKRLL